jgi:branched-chain amino acid aminotransferase
MSADIYYEVVRMISGKFLFLEDHLDRLQSSFNISGLTYPGNEPIRQNLRLLQQNNDFSFGNIRICLKTVPGKDPELLCYFVPYVYPETCMYKSGVQLVTYPHERPNPGIKKWDDLFRVSVSQHIRDHGVYEAVLLNGMLQITEGSRSNVFFIDPGNRLVTAPESEVLPGITRKYVLQICQEESIPVTEAAIPYEKAGDMKTCFISGTSPKVLPVWQIDGFQYDVNHPILQVIMERFENLLTENLESLL